MYHSPVFVLMFKDKEVLLEEALGRFYPFLLVFLCLVLVF